MTSCSGPAANNRASKSDCPSRGGLVEKISRTDSKAGSVTEAESVTRPTRKVGHDEDKSIRPRNGDETRAAGGGWADIPQCPKRMHDLAFRSRDVGIDTAAYRDVEFRNTLDERAYRIREHG